MVKIPGTVEGAPVVAEMIARGHQHQHHPALLDRLVRARRLGLCRGAREATWPAASRSTASPRSPPSSSAASTRWSTRCWMRRQRPHPGNAAKYEALKGKIAVANAKLAYAKYQEIFGSDRFAKLRAAGAKPQRPLWASTGTKNPAYSDTLYVDTLIGPDTVNTMPEKTIAAFLDHGTVERTVDQDVDLARQQMKQLAELGIDIDAVTDQLEDEGIASFIKSFESLLAGVEAKRSQLAGVR